MWILDLAVLTAVSLALSWRAPFLGVVVFTLGLFFGFQARRSRLLVGLDPAPVSTGRRVRAALASLLVSSAAAALFSGSLARSDSFEAGSRLDALFPLVLIVGFLAAALMAGLGVEGRKR